MFFENRLRQEDSAKSHLVVIELIRFPYIFHFQELILLVRNLNIPIIFYMILKSHVFDITHSTLSGPAHCFVMEDFACIINTYFPQKIPTSRNIQIHSCGPLIKKVMIEEIQDSKQYNNARKISISRISTKLTLKTRRNKIHSSVKTGTYY